MGLEALITEGVVEGIVIDDDKIVPIAVPTPVPDRTPDKVNHPPHYNKHPAGIECIEVVEGFNFNVGNAIKYLWRVGLKSTNRLEDLQKAQWYVKREIERLSK